jgi:protein LTV1
LLDDKFDEFYDGYDDENLGGLDCEEIEGSRPETSDVMKQILSDFEAEKRLQRQRLQAAEKVQVRIF